MTEKENVFTPVSYTHLDVYKRQAQYSMVKPHFKRFKFFSCGFSQSPRFYTVEEDREYVAA